MNELIVKKMTNRYQKSKISEQTKVREILQQTVLLGLKRQGFFEKAASSRGEEDYLIFLTRKRGTITLIQSPAITRDAAEIFHDCSGSPRTNAELKMPSTGTRSVKGATDPNGWWWSSQLQSPNASKVER